MITEELLRLAKQGENNQLEFKKTTGQLRAGMKTVCAFLNGQGGKVLFGVSDRGQMFGQLVSSKTLEDIAREFKRLDPAVSPAIDVIDLDNGRSVIAITVEPCEGPYTYDGRPYERVGAVTGVMPRTVLRVYCLNCCTPQGVGRISLFRTISPWMILMQKKSRLYLQMLSVSVAWKPRAGWMLNLFLWDWS